MKQRFLDKDWWKNTTGATAGTIIGIILTFGTTFYIENRNNAEMARKTVMITLHNLDSAIDTMEMLLQELQRRDSLFTRVCSLMPDKYEQMGNDSLILFVNTFGSHRMNITDNTAESIFSNSFEVWQYLDDEKVIGRIGNCYSILHACYEQYDKIQNLRMDAFRAYWHQYPPTDYPNPKEAFLALIQRNDVRYVLSVHNTVVRLLERTYGIMHRLNERNKQVLGIPQEELDEIGNLLEQNSYDLSGKESK